MLEDTSKTSKKLKKTFMLTEQAAEALTQYANQYCRGNETKALNAILESTSNTSLAANRSIPVLASISDKMPAMPAKSVKEGDVLPLSWELKPYVQVKVNGKPWVLFPDDRVLAARLRSANGYKTWLEAVKYWEPEQWQSGLSGQDWEQTVKNLIQIEQVKKHPAIRSERDSAKQAIQEPPSTTQEPPTWIPKTAKQIAEDLGIPVADVKAAAHSGADWVKFDDGRYWFYPSKQPATSMTGGKVKPRQNQ
ncbi:hypothetical protein [Microseira sp. BLCC-F43]|jgi:hypothetical protein|uniref:hypothetical protein n=1 Tax=Microseira sp. BLCC-F43 TaxID=3153602 RepID=UPI0035BA6935